MLLNFLKKQTQSSLLAVFSLSSPLMALELPSIFTDNMVLQRGQKVTLWGKSNAQKVGVKFHGQTVVAEVKDGHWEATLEPMQAHTKPRKLIIKDSNETITLSNVLVGDVFFCAGQSNMEMPVTSSSDCNDLVAKSANSQIRICASIQDMSTKPMDYFPRGVNGWNEASPDALATTGVVPKRGFSGTAYSFAYHYQKETKIPVGVFVSAWGGVSIHAFTDAEGIEQYTSQIASGRGKHRTSVLYNTLVHPLTRFSIAGVLWYQGEEDTARRVKDYDKRMEIMIERWRASWNNPELPFYFVQICPFNYTKRFPGIDLEAFWRQQRAAAKNIKNAWMIETEDIGNLNDIHPHNKLEVGKRLAKLAVEQTK